MKRTRTRKPQQKQQPEEKQKNKYNKSGNKVKALHCESFKKKQFSLECQDAFTRTWHNIKLSLFLELPRKTFIFQEWFYGLLCTQQKVAPDEMDMEENNIKLNYNNKIKVKRCKKMESVLWIRLFEKLKDSALLLFQQTLYENFSKYHKDRWI